MDRTDSTLTREERHYLLAMYLATSNLGMGPKERPKSAREIRQRWDEVRSGLYAELGDEEAGQDELKEWQKDLRKGGAYSFEVGLTELPWLIRPEDVPPKALAKISPQIARREKQEEAQRKKQAGKKKQCLDEVREMIDPYFTFSEREGEEAIRFDSGDCSIWIYTNGEIDGNRKEIRKALRNDLQMVNNILTHAGYPAI